MENGVLVGHQALLALSVHGGLPAAACIEDCQLATVIEDCQLAAFIEDASCTLWRTPVRVDGFTESYRELQRKTEELFRYRYTDRHIDRQTDG